MSKLIKNDLGPRARCYWIRLLGSHVQFMSRIMNIHSSIHSRNFGISMNLIGYSDVGQFMMIIDFRC